MAKPTIQKRDLALHLALLIRDSVQGEDGFVAYARELVHDDATKALCDESVEAIGAILWEKTSEGEMANMARQCGYISALFELAKAWEIELPDDVLDLAPWCDVICPATPM